VTVAPAMGFFAALITTPTIVPADIALIGALSSSAVASDATPTIETIDKTRVFRAFFAFIVVISFSSSFDGSTTRPQHGAVLSALTLETAM
jgi:hypothetical protein